MLGAFPKSYGVGVSVNAARHVNQLLTSSVCVKQDAINNALLPTASPPEPPSGKPLHDIMAQNQFRNPCATTRTNGKCVYSNMVRRVLILLTELFNVIIVIT